MSLLTLLLVLIVIGLVLYLINNFLPLDPVIRRIINIVVVIMVIVFLLRALGVWTYLTSIKV